LAGDLSILIGASRRARIKVDRDNAMSEQASGGQSLGSLARQARWECDALFELIARRLAPLQHKQTEAEVVDAH
jgi:hypothetical protein